MSESPDPTRAELGPGEAILKVETGIRGLDEILCGGLPVGRTTLLSGGPGTGKTLLATEFLYRGATAGAPGVLVSFEEPVGQVRANAAAVGMDLASLEEGGALRVVHAPTPHGAVRAGEFDIHGFLATLEGHIAHIDARRVVIDAIDVLMRIFADPEREREQLYLFPEWVRDRGLTVILTAKSGDEAQLVYPFLDYMADCVILLDQRMERQVRTRRLTVVKYRGSGFLPNESPYVLSPEGVVLMPVSMMSLQQPERHERISSGSEALDALLGGGYFRGSCVLIGGPSGSGKSTLGCLFSAAACRRGERVLYVSFEESVATLTREMCSVGVDLETPAQDGEFRVHAAVPESAGTEEHLLRILRTMEAWAPRHVVVDAISACERMGSQDAAFDFCVHLLTACRARGITCVYTHQSSAATTALRIAGHALSSLFDALIVLTYHDDGRELTRRLLIVKSRGGAHSMRHQEFAITAEGIVFADAGQEGE